MFFNGTSAAAPVVAGLVALFLQSKPDATSAEVKDFIKGHGSQKLSTTEWEDTTNDTDADYWRQYIIIVVQRVEYCLTRMRMILNLHSLMFLVVRVSLPINYFKS